MGADLIVKGIMGLLIVAAIGFAVYSLNKVAEQHYVKPYQERWDKEKDVLTKRGDQAEKANVELQADLANLDERVRSCNASVDSLKKRSDDAKSASDAALAKARVETVKSESLLSELTKSSASWTRGANDAVKCGRADGVLTDYASGLRVRAGQGGPGAGQSGPVEGGQGDGSGAVLR